MQYQKERISSDELRSCHINSVDHGFMLLNVIANEVKQSLRFVRGLLRQKALRNDTKS
jgi:hypothetical protein